MENTNRVLLDRTEVEREMRETAYFNDYEAGLIDYLAAVDRCHPVNVMDWYKIFYDFLSDLTCITNGKQQYFPQDNGTWFSRISGKYLTVDQMTSEYLEDLRSLVNA